MERRPAGGVLRLLLVDAAMPCRHAVGDRWFVDETYVKVSRKWRYAYGRKRLGR